MLDVWEVNFVVLIKKKLEKVLRLANVTNSGLKALTPLIQLLVANEVNARSGISSHVLATFEAKKLVISIG